MPYVYSAYFGAISFLKLEEVTAAVEDNLLLVSKQLLIKKLQQPFQNLSGNFLPVYCYDDFPKRKKELYPEYKENRKKKDDSKKMSFRVRNTLLLSVKNRDGYHLSSPDEEADDVIATAKKMIDEKLKGQDYRIYILSTDNDLLQLTDDHTVCVDIMKGSWGIIKDKTYLAEKYGLNNFKKVLLHKICFGDTSDNIKGIIKPHTRKAPIIAKINECNNLKDFVLDSGFVAKEKIPEVKKLMNLIILRDNLPCKITCNEGNTYFKGISL